MKTYAKLQVLSVVVHMITLAVAWPLELSRFLFVCLGSAVALRLAVAASRAAQEEA